MTMVKPLHLHRNEDRATLIQTLSLKMLILFGSQARGNTHPNSDYDFAVLYQESYRPMGFEYFQIYEQLADIFNISSDEIDVSTYSELFTYSLSL